MDTAPDNSPSCPECHGSGIKPCRSAADLHMFELATFCSCGHGQLRWAATLQQLSRAEREASSHKRRASISMDP
jgi:hypothetical protein